ncbi:Txe/YoeB family addiction module toxin [Dyadobacter sp. CY343]|uniref:Txe/YoeB family addiction module toxin n=1 Tax=Dyadobacter sp. CY343 TaxID=2907299 RepID=UPI001F184A68|nr:Txe/YoeB family addiction module toxin [Dyadobacter sp. CY343]MCE7058941.1 Txe/YoeB family addiction module toxin [Dyadobacter sp. CY343]
MEISRKLIFSSKAQEDLQYWKKSGSQSIQKKIEELIRSIIETPFHGIGKPEALKYELAGSWSRRINREHRIVYQVNDEFIKIESLKGHY